jgi:hypothetical protein
MVHCTSRLNTIPRMQCSSVLKEGTLWHLLEDSYQQPALELTSFNSFFLFAGENYKGETL